MRSMGGGTWGRQRRTISFSRSTHNNAARAGPQPSHFFYISRTTLFFAPCNVSAAPVLNGEKISDDFAATFSNNSFVFCGGNEPVRKIGRAPQGHSGAPGTTFVPPATGRTRRKFRTRTRDCHLFRRFDLHTGCC